MSLLRSLLILPAFHNLINAEFGLVSQLFQLSGAASVNNAKLSWAFVDGATQYVVQQSIGYGAFQTIATVTGDTYDSYGLTVGSTYNWRVTASNGNAQVDQSSTTSLTPFAPQNQYNTYDNTVPTSLRIKSSLLSNGVYYRYNYETFSNGSFSRFVEQTSSDGYTFSGDKTVLTGDVLCRPSNYDCKLESVSFQPHPSLDQFVMWAHYERSGDYGLGYVAAAHGTPGQNLQFDGAYRPLGDDSRDMTFFVDGENAYLVTSTDTNTNNNIYSLTANWTAVDQRLAQVNVNGHREVPAVIKANNWFYLFTSRAAGWLPSQPQYIAATNMAGPWSNPVNVANTATFSAQSGGVAKLESTQDAMMANQWSNNWPTRGGPTRQLMLPISLAPGGGFASYHFYRTTQYSDDISTQGQGLYGVQTGRILSVGKPSSSNAGTQGIALANDGVQDTPDRFFKPSTVPFWYQIDLQDAHAISQVDLTTNLVQGTETFYRFNVTGSNDGNTWTPLADQSNNVNPGFAASFPTSTERFRYIRINVNQIRNNVNGNEADFTGGVTEVTVYGS
ncbi:hypothetical protein PRZ48_004574 [Zasmidium cellare]|uniref:F5/8 type C domain-containing protein n=1 Tax=Zasmidium cellare TaxID=395010 RepID=A0ABR0EPY1_ZASCE|nr:hypothetical protein PRZ48_004574 [Zasmidium cellare]